MKAIGANAFELSLPDTMHIHPVFNVCLLCKYHGEYHLPGPIIAKGEEEYEVERLLRHRGYGKCRQYLICWKGYDTSKDCWLKENELQNAPLVL